MCNALEHVLGRTLRVFRAFQAQPDPADVRLMRDVVGYDLDHAASWRATMLAPGDRPRLDWPRLRWDHRDPIRGEQRLAFDFGQQ